MRISYSNHLVRLVERWGEGAARLRAISGEARRQLAAQARRESSRLSARLDASPLLDATANAVDRGEIPAAVHPLQRAGGWAGAVKLDGMATQDVAAVEYANLLTCFDAEPGIAGWFFEKPAQALQELHGLICAGLVDTEVLGRSRRTSQAVHDGAQGRIIYLLPDPDRLAGLLAGLTDWLERDSAALPALLVAGVVQERLLEWHPFEAANGRLARAASRVVLRARGADPDGVVVVERDLAADPLGYHAEVAATIRRRGDLGRWLERYAEAAVNAMDEAITHIS